MRHSLCISVEKRPVTTLYQPSSLLPLRPLPHPVPSPGFLWVFPGYLHLRYACATLAGNLCTCIPGMYSWVALESPRSPRDGTQSLHLHTPDVYMGSPGEAKGGPGMAPADFSSPTISVINSAESTVQQSVYVHAHCRAGFEGFCTPTCQVSFVMRMHVQITTGQIVSNLCMQLCLSTEPLT